MTFIYGLSSTRESAGSTLRPLRIVGYRVGNRYSTQPDPGFPGWVIVGNHGLVIPDTEFNEYVLTPTINFPKSNPTECVIYQLTHEPDPLTDGPSWETLLSDYMFNCGQEYFYTENTVPTLDTVRGKIVMALESYPADGFLFGLDFSGFPSNAFGPPVTNTLCLGRPVTFYVQNIYDDKYKGDQASEQVTAIQQNIQNAAANTDPLNWYMTSTNRADGAPSSYQFALGPLTNPPYPRDGYNRVALDQIEKIPIATGGMKQQTVGVVFSDFPNRNPGYIHAIYIRNPRLA